MVDQALSALARKLQAVCVFAADIIPTDEPLYADFGWRSGRGLEPDKTGPVFSHERVLAAAALYRMNPSMKIVPSGGYTNVDGKQSVPISTVIAFELAQLGVPLEAVIEEPRASSTRYQIVYCSEIVRDEGWQMNRVAILAPCWQFARITAMLANMPAVGPLVLGVTHLIGMERALAAEDAGWNARFAEWYETPEAREMFAKEALGAGQLWAGHQPKYPNPFRRFKDPLG